MKLVIGEPESRALRDDLRRRLPLVATALARTEMARALLPLSDAAIRAGRVAS